MLQSVIPLINMGRGGQGLKGKVLKRGRGGGGWNPLPNYRLTHGQK